MKTTTGRKNSRNVMLRISPVIVEELQHQADAANQPLAVYCRQQLERLAIMNLSGKRTV